MYSPRGFRRRGYVVAGLFICAACIIAAAPVALQARPARPAASGMELSVDTGAPDGWLEYGHTAHFTYTVVNTGDAALTGLSGTDTLGGDLGPGPDLAPGASHDFTADVLVDERAMSGRGTFSVTALDAQGQPVSSSVEYTFEVVVKDTWTDFAVTKQALKSTVSPGGTVRYRLTIVNHDSEKVDEDGGLITVTDDFDESRARVRDASGGTITAGTLVWKVAPPGPGEAPVIIEYELAVDADATGTMPNAVSIFYTLEDDNTNDRAAASVKVVAGSTSTGTGAGATPTAAASSGTAETDDPFLPFTGAPLVPTLPLAGLFALAGVAVRRLASKGVSRTG